MTSKRNILANFERLFKPTPGHSFTLLVVKRMLVLCKITNIQFKYY